MKAEVNIWPTSRVVAHTDYVWAEIACTLNMPSCGIGSPGSNHCPRLSRIRYYISIATKRCVRSDRTVRCSCSRATAIDKEGYAIRDVVWGYVVISDSSISSARASRTKGRTASRATRSRAPAFYFEQRSSSRYVCRRPGLIAGARRCKDR